MRHIRKRANLDMAGLSSFMLKMEGKITETALTRKREGNKKELAVGISFKVAQGLAQAFSGLMGVVFQCVFGFTVNNT